MTGRHAPDPDQPYPWVVPDLYRWFGLLLLSAAGLGAAWWGISGSARLATQITWLNVGAAAVVVGGLGNVSWLLQGRRALGLRRRAVLAGIPVSALHIAPAAYPEADATRFAVPGTTKHHRHGCPAIAGKPTESMTAEEHERAGRRPCGICSG